MRYLPFLAKLHETLDPGTYLEIGLRKGNSLSLARCPSIGIDPDFTLTAELAAPTWLYRTTSDEYFARPDAMAAFAGTPVDLAFIDGMHLFEFALRDFMYVERHSAPWTVVVLDDIFPRDVDWAARERHTKYWTGDVFRIIDVLRKWRPDLTMTFVDTQPTGLLMIHGLDSASTVLKDNYDEIVAATVQPDPQDVPAEILQRQGVIPPEEALAMPVLAELRGQRAGGGAEAQRLLAVAARRPLGGPLDQVGAPSAAPAKKAAAKPPSRPAAPPSPAIATAKRLARRLPPPVRRKARETLTRLLK